MWTKMLSPLQLSRQTAVSVALKSFSSHKICSIGQLFFFCELLKSCLHNPARAYNCLDSFGCKKRRFLKRAIGNISYLCSLNHAIFTYRIYLYVLVWMDEYRFQKQIYFSVCVCASIFVNDLCVCIYIESRWRSWMPSIQCGRGLWCSSEKYLGKLETREATKSHHAADITLRGLWGVQRWSMSKRAGEKRVEKALTFIGGYSAQGQRTTLETVSHLGSWK